MGYKNRNLIFSHSKKFVSRHLLCRFRCLANSSFYSDIVKVRCSSLCFSPPDHKMAAISPDITFISKTGKRGKGLPCYIRKAKVSLEIPSRLPFMSYWSELIDLVTSSSKGKWECVFWVYCLPNKVRILLARKKGERILCRQLERYAKVYFIA